MAKTRNWIPNDKVLDDGIAKIKQMAEVAIIESLSKLAEDSIEHVLVYTKQWHNRTYNLSDSYGYAIYHNGWQIKKWMYSSHATKADAKGGTGSERGSDFLDFFNSTGDWQLVVVAGEFYAKDLEMLNGLDVLTGSFQYTRENFLRDFKRI